MDQPRNYEPYGGFSIVRIILSDALPIECFHPDILQGMQEKEDGLLVLPDKTQKAEKEEKEKQKLAKEKQKQGDGS